MAKKSEPKIIYSEYINSDLWRAKRQEFLKLGNHKNCCASCELPYRPRFHVHHLTYNRLGKENLEDLMLLCEPCHVLLHKHKPKGMSLKTWSNKFACKDFKVPKKSHKKKKTLSLREQREAEQLKKLKARAKKLEKTSKSKPIPPGTIVTSTLRKKRKRRR